MTESPQATAARAAAILISCRNRGTATLAAVEQLNNYVHALADECDRINALHGALHYEYGILDHGGGPLQAKDEPKPLPPGNAALCVELRATGIFDPDSRRPASLMRRQATDWEEIPEGVTPDGIMPGYSGHKADAARKAES